MTRSWSAGSVSSAVRTSLASSRRATSTPVSSRALQRPPLARLVRAGDRALGALAGLEALLEPLVARAAAVVDHAAPQRVDRAVVDDAEDPRAHRSAGAVVAGVGAPHREERLLDDLLGRRAQAHHAV